MILSPDKIKELISAPVDDRIVAARDMCDKLMLHVEGIGLQKFLARINNYENDAQFRAREKHAISLKFVTEELLRPTDNAFNARGGSSNFKFIDDNDEKEKELTNKLANIRNSHSLSWYIENEWFNKFITDPNGLIMIESDGENIEESKRKAYPTYKSISSIKTYEQIGIYVEYVVFEPHKKETVKSTKLFGGKPTETEYYWIVDDENWYLAIKIGDNIEVIETLKHGFDRVPAILCSDIIDNVTGWKKSPIDAQIELLDKLTTSTSVINIVEFAHNYPRPYLFADKCQRCNGTGNIGTGNKWVSCDNPACNNGSLLRRDVTDTILMKVPNTDEGETLIKSPGGYLSLPTEPLDLMYKSNDRLWNRIFFSQWGTVISKDSGKDYSTATGRYIDAQPVNNRLNKYSKSIERAHTALANFIGKFYYPLTFKEAFIQYGRRYLIETPDQIWEKYKTAKQADAPISSLDILLSQYVESEYRENETMYIVEMKKVKLEPFVHWSMKLVRESQTISDEDKQRKEFFSEWLSTKSVEEIYSTKIEELRTQLADYAKGKQINSQIKTQENGTAKVSGI